MTTQKPLNMAEITRLMRAGQLSEATQAIQANLGGASLPTASLPTGGLPTGGPPDGAAMPATKGAGFAGGLMDALRKGGLAGGTTAPPLTLPDGASWTSRTHQAAGETRDLRLYVPASLADGQAPAGLLLLLHGCTQDPDDFARGTGIFEAAEQNRIIVVAPEQSARSNMNRCWNWFETRHGARDSGEAAFLTDLTRTIAHEFAVPPDLRFAAGLSAGGAMAVTLGSVFADDFGAVACHSGLPNGAAGDMSGAFQAMSQGGSDSAAGVGCRLFVLHGSTDTTVSPRNADAVVRQALRRQTGLVQRRADSRMADRAVRITRYRDTEGALRVQEWRINGLGHAWSGGAAEGSHTAPGPSATQAMMAFFLN